MNGPMLYWFIPRGLVEAIPWLFGMVVLAVVGVMWWGVATSAPDARAKRLRLGILAMVVLSLFGFVGISHYLETQENKRQLAEQHARQRAAYEHFKKRCESTHVTFYKEVPPQDGVYIMKPGTDATAAQMADQFWMGDPADSVHTPEWEARELLFRRKSMPRGSWDGKQRGGFDYVEAPHPDKSGIYLRYTLIPDGTKDGKGFDGHKVTAEEVSERLSRYGYTWDDISTLEDRKYWVAGGRMRVVDLATGEIIAERVRYIFEKYQGVHSSTFNQRPWGNAESCGISTRDTSIPFYLHFGNGFRRAFVSHALGTWLETPIDRGSQGTYID